MQLNKYWLFLCLALLPCRGFCASAPQHDSVFVRGCWVHYFIVGSGIPVVHLPGGPGMSHVSLMPLTQLISGPLNCRNIIIDFRGVGPSRAELNEQNVGYDPIVDDIEAVRAKLNIKQWVVSGHSQGGQFAMYYTLKHPEAVSKLILLASVDADNSFQSYFGHSIATHLSPGMKDTMAKYSTTDEEKRDPMNAEYQTKKALITAYFYDYKKALEFTDTLSQATYFALNSTPYFMYFIRSKEYAQFSINDQLKNIKVPTLIIQGRQDCLGAEIPIGLHHRIKGSQLWFIDECGHLPWIEQPEILIRILAAFLL